MLFIIKNMDYEKQYRNILNNITTYGKYKKDRTGVGCHSLFNQSINISVEKYLIQNLNGLLVAKLILKCLKKII
jgi:thymidylate synthase